MSSIVSPEEVYAFLDKAFDSNYEAPPEILVMEKDRVVIRQAAMDRHMRPGGFISGPTQMALADHAAYLAVFTQLGIVPMAVTSNLNINFLRPCLGEALEAEARTLKLGRTLAVIEVEIKGDAGEKTASHAIVTYAIPADETTAK